MRESGALASWVFSLLGRCRTLPTFASMVFESKLQEGGRVHPARMDFIASPCYRPRQILLDVFIDATGFVISTTVSTLLATACV
jgi:hypothetical protein